MPSVLTDALAGGLGEGSLDGLESVASGPAGPAGDVAALYFNIDPSVLIPE